MGSSALSWGPPMLRRNHPPENGYCVLLTESLAFPEQVFLGYLSTGDTAESGIPVSTQEGRKKKATLGVDFPVL